MFIEDWEKNALQLERRILDFERSYGVKEPQMMLSAVQKYQAVLEYQNTMDRAIQDIVQAKKRHQKMTKRSASVLSWALILAKLAYQMYEKYAHLLVKKLWTNLIRMRLKRHSQNNNALLDDADLVAMATRELELIRYEKKLQVYLDELRQKRNSLEDLYQKLDTITANREAGHAMQRRFKNSLGFKDLVLETTKSFIQNISQDTRVRTKEGERVKQLEHPLLEGTIHVVEECRALVARNLGDDEKKPSADKLKNLLNKIEDLESLHQEIDKLRHRPIEVIVPKLHLKFLTKNDKTENTSQITLVQSK